MLLEESVISPDVVSERGYYTAQHRWEVPEAFAGYQRRLGLVVPVYSPDGETASSQLRPDSPRRDKKGKALKYETPGGSRTILDVHPRNHAAVRDPAVDLWITEGMKKGDALASRGECAISLVGVWNWQRAGKLLPCWDHVELKGRLVYVAFDSDAMSKEGVQLALEGLVAALEGRGADVRVVYLPGGEGGEKVGVDDYLAAGGTVAGLKALARRFEPEDLGRVRLSRDEKLRTAVRRLWRVWWDHDWMRMVGTGERGNWQRGHTARDVLKALIDTATRHGTLRAGGEAGIAVKVSTRTLALAAAKSRPSVMNALRNLEADGLIEILEAGAGDEARSYRLLTGYATLDHEGETGSEPPTGDPGGKDLRAPRLRWSSPGRKARRGGDKKTRRVRDNLQPAVPGVKRLGAARGAVVDALDSAGGELTLQALCELLHRSRPGDLRRRVLPMLEEAGILAVEGDVVTLASDWLARLEEARELGGELERERLDREKYRREQQSFRRRDDYPPDHHWANAVGADGFVEDLRPADEPEEAPLAAEIPVSPLAVAIRDYLDRNPGDVDHPPGRMALTLWALDLVEGKPTRAGATAALEELGGERYRRELLERTRTAG